MASSNRCSVCPKGAGTCFCPGCKAYFCDKDFRNHRGMLVNELDELTVHRNELQEKINKTSSDKLSGSSLLARIDKWQQETIEKVKQAAQQAREQALKIINGKREEVTRQFQLLSQDLEQLRETEGVLEQDLTRLKQQMSRINKDLEQLSQPPAAELNMKQSDQIVWNRMIYVEQEPKSLSREADSPIPTPSQANLECAGHACQNCYSCAFFMQHPLTWLHQFIS